MMPQQHMVVLIFVQAVGKAVKIDKAADLPQRAGRPQLLRHTGLRRGNRLLPRAGMGAAGIGPQAAGVVLPCRPFLQQQLPVIIDEEYREGPVQQRCGMGFGLPRRANGTVIAIDQNKVV